MGEKNKVREMLDGIVGDIIIFLKGEEKPENNPPLYTKEELKELYSVKKDVERTVNARKT